MPSEPRWLAAEIVVVLNADLVEETGEPHLTRDAGLLESACAVPINRFFYDDQIDVVHLAVALMLAIARNHPFQQGNKRTAFTVGAVFLDINGFDLTLPDVASAADLFVEVIQDQARVGELDELVRANIHAHEPAARA